MTTRTGDAARVTLARFRAACPDCSALEVASDAAFAHLQWRHASRRVGFTVGAHEQRVGNLLHRYNRALMHAAGVAGEMVGGRS